ncbi:MAG: glycosyltransferase family 2 protein [Vicinamibacterales bacterium]
MSVLIATRLRAEALASTLESLAAMQVGSISWDLAVIDNGGDVATQNVVAAFMSRLPVRLIVEPVPGKNRALNRGLQSVRGALVAFTDDDVTVDAGWLRELCEAAARWPDAAMFGGRILPIWPGGDAPPPHPFFEHAYGVADFAHPEGRYSSGYVYGANMAIRAEIFRDGWRFDERIGPDGTDRYVTGSETSLTVALERSGRRAVYLPRATVHHHIRPEQLTSKWLHGRAFRQGRAEARKRGIVGGVRAVPRELLLRAAREYAGWLACRLRRDRAGTLDRGLAFWRTRGMIYHCRVSRGRDHVQSRTT